MSSQPDTYEQLPYPEAENGDESYDSNEDHNQIRSGSVQRNEADLLHDETNYNDGENYDDDNQFNQHGQGRPNSRDGDFHGAQPHHARGYYDEPRDTTRSYSRGYYDEENAEPYDHHDVSGSYNDDYVKKPKKSGRIGWLLTCVAMLVVIITVFFAGAFLGSANGSLFNSSSKEENTSQSHSPMYDTSDTSKQKEAVNQADMGLALTRPPTSPPTGAPILSVLTYKPTAAPILSGLTNQPTAAPILSALTIPPVSLPAAVEQSDEETSVPQLKTPTKTPSLSPVKAPAFDLKDMRKPVGPVAPPTKAPTYQQGMTGAFFVDTNTQKVIESVGPIVNGTTYSLSDLGTHDLSIFINVTAHASRVHFTYLGTDGSVRTQVEKSYPFCMAGDMGDQDTSCRRVPYLSFPGNKHVAIESFGQYYTKGQAAAYQFFISN